MTYDQVQKLAAIDPLPMSTTVVSDSPDCMQEFVRSVSKTQPWLS